MRQQTYVLREERDRRFALDAVRRAAIGLEVRIGKAKRTPEQNRFLHGRIGDIAGQLPWPPPPSNSGELHDIEWWKRRCTLGWLKENRQEAEVITDLEGDGEFGLLLPHTSDLTTEQCAALSEWVMAFGAQNGVTFTEPARGPDPPVSAYKDER